MLTCVSVLDIVCSMLLRCHLFVAKKTKSSAQRQARNRRLQLFLMGPGPRPDSLISATPDRAPAAIAPAEAEIYGPAVRRRLPAQAQTLDPPPSRPIPADGPRTVRVTSFTLRPPFSDNSPVASPPSKAANPDRLHAETSRLAPLTPLPR